MYRITMFLKSLQRPQAHAVTFRILACDATDAEAAAVAKAHRWGFYDVRVSTCEEEE